MCIEVPTPPSQKQSPVKSAKFQPPLKKVTPLFPSTPPLKTEVLSRPPF